MSELVRLAKEALRQQKEAEPVISPGATIQWEGADLITRQGIVDLIHTDPDGGRWAFVTVGEGWCAVNLKFARRKS